MKINPLNKHRLKKLESKRLKIKKKKIPPPKKEIYSTNYFALYRKLIERIE